MAWSERVEMVGGRITVNLATALVTDSAELETITVAYRKLAGGALDFYDPRA